MSHKWINRIEVNTYRLHSNQRRSGSGLFALHPLPPKDVELVGVIEERRRRVTRGRERRTHGNRTMKRKVILVEGTWVFQ